MKKILSVLLSVVLLAAILIAPQTVYGANYMTMRNITAYDLVAEMNVGINIGDTLDSSFGNGETYWGNPRITKDLILAYKNAGFNTIRLPVTWDGSINSTTGEPNAQWLARVKEVVDWILEEEMYCIVNTHHEMGWLNTSDTGMDLRKVKFGNLWTAIANQFKDYGDHLLFEGYNEMRKSENAWNASGTDYQNLNELSQVFVNSVRATGSNNSSRTLVISTYAANFDTVGFDLPTDTIENRLAVEFHSYYPQGFCFVGGTDSFGSQSDNNEITNYCSKFQQYIISKVPVILGEFGAVNKNNDSARAAYAQQVVQTCNSYGIKAIWWDNGKVTATNGGDSFALIDRTTYQIAKPGIVSALVNNAYSTPAPNNSSNTAQTYLYEAEILNRTSNADVEVYTANNDYNCGTNKFLRMCNTNPAVGNYIEFTVPSLQSGTYNLLVPTRATPTRSKFNISVDGTQTASNVNFAYTDGSSGFIADYVPIDCGNITITSNKVVNIKIRFTISQTGTSAEYSHFSKAMGLPQQRERVYGDGLGNIGKGKYKIPVEKSGKSGIIELYKRKGIEVVSSPEISSKTIKQVEKATKKVTSDFKVLETYSEPIVFSDVIDGLAENSYDPNTGLNKITLRKDDFANPDKLLELLHNDFISGKSYETDTIQSLVAHELGHNAHIALALKNSSIPYGWKLTTEQIHIFKNNMLNIRNDIYKKVFGNLEFAEITKKQQMS